MVLDVEWQMMTRHDAVLIVMIVRDVEVVLAVVVAIEVDVVVGGAVDAVVVVVVVSSGGGVRPFGTEPVGMSGGLR